MMNWKGLQVLSNIDWAKGSRILSKLDWAKLRADFGTLATRDLEITSPVGASAVVGAFVVLATILATMAGNALSSSIEQRDAKAELLASLEKRRLDRPANGEGEGTMIDTRDPFVDAASETLAAAEIDRFVRKAVAESNGTVLSSRADPKHDDEGAVRRIGAEIVVEGKIEAIQSLLFKLETGTPFVFVEDLALQPSMEEGKVSAAPKLRASITASAYWRNSS